MSADVVVKAMWTSALMSRAEISIGPGKGPGGRAVCFIGGELGELAGNGDLNSWHRRHPPRDQRLTRTDNDGCTLRPMVDSACNALL